MNIYKYYYKDEVLKEIAEFSRNRWVAVHCERKMRDGRYLLLRYESGRPITFSKASDIKLFLIKHSHLKPRTFYASCNIYKRLLSREDALNYTENVIARTPTWDIDSKINWWKYTLEAARLIVDILEKEGVVKSVYLKWSGNGVHVHIHEKAFSQEILAKISVFNATYAIVEYITRKVHNKILELNKRYSINMKVENLMDPQRVFTVPLSLHRELEVSCVVFKPEDIDSFDIEWTDPQNYRHSKDWRVYVEGEADDLAWRAYRAVGEYPGTIEKRRVAAVGEEISLAKSGEATHKEIASFLKSLRLCVNPTLLDIKKGFKNSREALNFLENVLSMYALAEIDYSKTIYLIEYVLNAVIPFQGLQKNEEKLLSEIYRTVLSLLREKREREDIKKWLLSHGPPRKRLRTLDEFL